MAEWNVVAKARRDFANLLDGLSAEQLAAQSLCEEWSNLDVAGHLVSLVDMSTASWAKGYVKHRNNLDGYISDVAKEFAQQGAPQLAQTLRANAAKKMRPYTEASMVNDTAVHFLDVVRPLGLDVALDREVLVLALDSAIGEFTKKSNAPAVRFVADDVEWSAGQGAEITGPGEAILLALNDRDSSNALDGPGVSLLS